VVNGKLGRKEKGGKPVVRRSDEDALKEKAAQSARRKRKIWEKRLAQFDRVKRRGLLRQKGCNQGKLSS